MRLSRSSITALAAALFFLPAAAPALENPVLIDLAGSAGRIGTATFFQTDGRVLVNVEFANTHLQGMQVEIDQGSCGKLQGLETQLTKSVDGQSQTELPSSSLTSLVDRPHALVIRKAAWAAPMACGNIKG